MASHAAEASNRKGSLRLGSYLRRLRAGYGYSLRRVEEKARAEGGEIDNSQLSRYEKGICYPSFDKLRVLASVFNVSIQAFSDVVDLEAYEDLKPETGEPTALLESGHRAVRAGETAQAFAFYERALEILEDPDREVETDAADIRSKARISLALALHRLGKLALAEQELRNALRVRPPLQGALLAQALLNLANIHADQGDLILAELEAERSYSAAAEAENEIVAARAMHTLGRVLAGRGELTDAVERYRDAVERYRGLEEAYEAIRVRINIGGCYVRLGKSREGVRLLREALAEARSGGHRRLEAQAWSYLGQAFLRQGDLDKAGDCLRHSDAIAGNPRERFADLLFVNAYHEWKLAGTQANPTREKIAFGRLKALRSALERRAPEVDAFDAYVEKGQSHA